MSKDLIKRLRNMELNPCSRPQARWGEAADEIERLRGLLKEIVDGSYWDDEHTLVPHDLFDKIEKEVSDE